MQAQTSPGLNATNRLIARHAEGNRIYLGCVIDSTFCASARGSTVPAPAGATGSAEVSSPVVPFHFSVRSPAIHLPRTRLRARFPRARRSRTPGRALRIPNALPGRFPRRKPDVVLAAGTASYNRETLVRDFRARVTLTESTFPTTTMFRTSRTRR